jgi:hypothetical protein
MINSSQDNFWRHFRLLGQFGLEDQLPGNPSQADTYPISRRGKAIYMAETDFYFPQLTVG